MSRMPKRIAVALCAVLLVSVFSCKDLFDLTMPTSLVISSSDAKFSAPIGNYVVNLNEYLNAEELQKQISANAPNQELYVYDYNEYGVSSVQEYIIEYPIKSFSLNVAKQLEDLDLGGTLNKSFEQTISIPQSQEMSSDTTIQLPALDEKIRDKVQIDNLELPLYELGANIFLSTGDATWAGQELAFTISAPQFDEITFSHGSLNLTFSHVSSTPPAESFVADIQVGLKDKNNTIISASELDEGKQGKSILGGNSPVTLTIPLAEKTLTSAMRLAVMGKIGGGDAGTKHSYNISVSFSSDTKIKRITGVTMDTSALDNMAISIDQNISMDALENYLVKAKVKSGYLHFSGELPDGWTGIKQKWAVSVSGGIAIPSGEMLDVSTTDAKNYLFNKMANLTTKEVTPQTQLHIGGTVSLWLQNATLTFSNTNMEIPLKVSCVIEEVSSAVLNIEKLITKDMSEDLPIEFPEAVQTYMKNAVLNKIGITGTISTTLPTDSLYTTITFSSPGTPLNIPNLKDTINVADAANNTIDLHTAEDWTATITPATENTISLKTEISLSGCDPEMSNVNDGTENYLTVTSLKFGETYTISSNLSFDYGFISATVDLGMLTNSNLLQNTIDTGLNLKELFTNLIDGDGSKEDYEAIINQIAFSDIEGFIYVTKPSTASEYINNITMSGSLIAKFDDSSENLIDSGAIAIKDERITFSSLAKTNRIITSPRMFDEDVYSTKTKEGVLTNIINSRPSNLSFAYDFTISGGEITVCGDDFSDDANSDDAIKIALALRVPLKLNIKPENDEYIEIEDFMSFIGNPLDEDILDRDEDWDAEDVTKYMDIIKNIQCVYVFENTIGLQLSANFTARDNPDIIQEKSLYFDNQTHTFYLTRTEIKNILESELFVPVIQARIAGGEFSVPRNAKLRLNMILKAETDGQVEIWKKDD